MSDKVVDFLNGLDLLHAKLPSKLLSFVCFSSSFVIDVCSSCHELKMFRFALRALAWRWEELALLLSSSLYVHVCYSCSALHVY